MIVLGVIRSGQVADHNALGAGRMDHFSVTDIDTHMGHTLAVCILQKYQIAGLQAGLGNVGSHLDLLGGGSWQADTALLKYILDKAGTVKTAGSGPTPDVGCTQILFGVGDDLLRCAALDLQSGGTG